MISISIFDLSNDKQEILPELPEGFPYICGIAELDHYVDRCFSWHWHSVFEIGYVDAGEMELQTPDVSVTLKPGEAYFVNANVMHDLRSKDGCPGCRLYSHKFELEFLAGDRESYLSRKYLNPIVRNPRIQTYVLRPDSRLRIHILHKIWEIIELSRNECFGYEFEIRAELCRLWCLFLEETQHLHCFGNEIAPPENERIKLMIAYIQKNYAERLTLAQIAAAANVSIRECSRCFLQSIKQSPMQYVNRYRLRMAIQRLSTTTDSIVSISEACGFSTVSYFGKVFREAVGMTPKAYQLLAHKVKME